MRVLFTAVSLATIMAAGTFAAQAADLIIEPEAPVAEAAAFDWTGFYAGVSIGGSWANFSYESPDAPETDYDAEANGFVGGAQAGYNWQFDNIVVGVQTDIAYIGAETDEGDTLEWLGTTTARLGLAVDSLLLYGKAGVAYGTVHLYTDYFGTPEDEANTHIGWTAGIGAEFALTSNVTASLEYDYVDLGEQNYFAGLFNAAGVNTSVSAHVLKAGLNFKF